MVFLAVQKSWDAFNYVSGKVSHFLRSIGSAKTFVGTNSFVRLLSCVTWYTQKCCSHEQHVRASFQVLESPRDTWTHENQQSTR